MAQLHSTVLSRGLKAAVLALSLVIGHSASAQVSADIPRQANGKPDLSGIWQILGEADYDLEPHAGRRDAPPGPGVVEGGTIPYRADALEQRKENFEQRAEDDPAKKCWSLGVPRSVYYPAPFQIFQRERDLTLIHQLGHQVRTIHTNGTLHPVELDAGLWLGDSRGKWEGDTLVVDVNGFAGETWLDRSGNFHSESLHVVEKWTLIDANTISYTATMDDPEVFTAPWTIDVLLHRRRDKNFQVIEDYCFTLPYDQYYPHKDGAQ
ncbi:hypothetical protein [Altererythrobacter sp. Root672]|uniref:hypothetical protein n=1 Tax=Altererythrobacter sp. Root672 TaxID=1736584 RepID=UPI0006FEF014|nr:hypothetical protein [Altererythrobacter sp. Root672]KRA83620.1 hypothetical protein ASD76_06200 [Altererythrobacter sp. Root672]